MECQGVIDYTRCRVSGCTDASDTNGQTDAAQIINLSSHEMGGGGGGGGAINTTTKMASNITGALIKTHQHSLRFNTRIQNGGTEPTRQGG